MLERHRFERELADLDLREYEQPQGSKSTAGRAFRLGTLPLKVQQIFMNGPAAWREAVREAIDKGIKDVAALADIIFFMQHPERMGAGTGKLINSKEPDFFKLRVEWVHYQTIVTRILKPSTKPTVFLPARVSSNYEDFVARPTTGRITLMVNGRNWNGAGGFVDHVSTFDRMQETVESLGPGDSVFIANWQFFPTELPLTIARSSIANWGELLALKAKEGVKVRVIIAQHPPFSIFMTKLTPLDKVITTKPTELDAKPDNFKYIVTPHAHLLGVHHQKFMVARKGKRTVAFCGGIDISFNRTPAGWGTKFVWHDVGAKLEGLIARDFEREFVERWNHESANSKAKPLPQWKPFEKLTKAAASRDDQVAGVNEHPLQMHRTLSRGLNHPSDIRRDDVWRGYFRLIGRATRFIYLENQYFQEPKIADAIVKQAEAQPDLIVIVLAGTGTDDRQSVDPKATDFERAKQQAAVDVTQNAFALRHEFFKRLFSAPLNSSNRLRVYTLQYPEGMLHSKLILVDDEALSVGSANANPRGFFFDSEINVMLDHPATVRNFRLDLWAHNLGVMPHNVDKWIVSNFIATWDALAASNLQKPPDRMVGERVIPFNPLDPSDPRFRQGRRGSIRVPPSLRSLVPAEIQRLLDNPPEALF